MLTTPTFPPDQQVAEVFKPALAKSGTDKIVDLCSGSGLSLVEVQQYLREHEKKPVRVVLTDPKPNLKDLEHTTRKYYGGFASFKQGMVEPSNIGKDPTLRGVRTMFGCFHERPPSQGILILQGGNLIAPQP